MTASASRWVLVRGGLVPPLTGVALLLAATSADAHPLHATTGSATTDLAPAVVLLAVAGGLLAAPALTGLAAGLRSALLLRSGLALAAAGAAFAGHVEGARLVVLLGLAVLPLAPAAGLATGLLLLVVPGLLQDPGLVPAAHLLGAGLWSGTVLHVLLGLGRRPDAAALRAAGPVAGASALLAVGSGLAAAWQHGLGPSLLAHSSYGRLLLTKGVVVAAVLLLGLLVTSPGRPRVPALRLEAVALGAVLVLGGVLAAGPGVVPDLRLPRGLAVAHGSSLLVARDASGTRWLHVTGRARLALPGTVAALDGAQVAPLPAATRRVVLGGRPVALPAPTVLAPGPGGPAERLAATLGGLLSGSSPAPGRVPAAAALVRPGLHRGVVLVDDDPRGRTVARELPGSRAVDVRRPGALHADVVYVATSWDHALEALARAQAAAPLGGVVVLPWLVAPTTVDQARGGSVLLVAGAPLEDGVALRYREALRVLPGERPSVTGLDGFRGGAPAPTVSTYAAGGAGIFPAGLDPHGAHASGLPPWVDGGALTPVRRLHLSGAPA